MTACTIVARNYLAHARVLARSHAAYHEGERLAVLVVDAEVGPPLGTADEPFDVIRPSQLPLDPLEYRRMATIYDVMELSTAVKPWLLQLLLDRGAPWALYLDPDIEIFAPLTDLGPLAAQHGIVLIPHALAPIPEDGKRPTPQDIADAGVYNLGFIAVGPAARPFLDWWSERLRRDCIVSIEEGLFVDQRLLDAVPRHYDHTILRDPTLNVAYWNLHERRINWADGRYEVNRQPLRFFHFSGFDPDKPDRLSKHQGDRPRTDLSREPDLARLCHHYAEQLRAAGYDDARQTEYGYARTAYGIALDRRMRRLYRQALIAADGGATLDAPDPFDPAESAGFVKWLSEPGATTPIPRYLLAVWRERPDLRVAFPKVESGDAGSYLNWLRADGRVSPPIPLTLGLDTFLASGPRVPAEPIKTPLPEGVNVAGYVLAELGVGEAARLIVATLKEAGTPYSVVPYTVAWNRQESDFADRGTGAPIYDINIICVNADQLPGFAESVGKPFLAGRYNVAMWWWEVDRFPHWMAATATLVDEIWVGSKHAADAIAPMVDRPVSVFPLPIVSSPVRRLSRAELGLPDGYFFLFSFDFHSVFERKNPLAVVTAFTRAFAPETGPFLVIKSINGDAHPHDLARLRDATVGRSDIHIRDGYMSPDSLHALTASCDAYVSLHRSEGFGLTMAEAMALGKPVIATGYSGNLEYMNATNSFLVPYILVAVGPGNDPYPADARWAEPDIEAAAELMRHVFEGRSTASKIGEKAREDITRDHSPATRAALISQLLATARSRRTRSDVSPDRVASTGDATIEPQLHRIAGSLGLAIAAGPQLRSPRRAVRFVQRVLLRILRPLSNHQRELTAGLLDALMVANARMDFLAKRESDLETRLAGPLQRSPTSRRADLENAVALANERAAGAVQRVEQIAAALQSDVGLANERAAEAGQRVEQLATSLTIEISAEREQTAAAIQRLEKTIANVRESFASAPDSAVIAEVDSRLSGAIDRLSSHLAEASTHLQVIEDKISSLLAQVNQLNAEVNPVPYMSDTSLLRSTDPAGRLTIGFKGSEDGSNSEQYLAFEDLFRGREEFIRDRQRAYVELLRPHAPVLDLGCGRGELLDLLAAAGISATGVDIDAGMVTRSRSKGHLVVKADAVSYLGERANDSIASIFSAQFIEHLTADQVRRLLEVSLQKLRPGGLFVAETPNPHSMSALKMFWIDLTHEKPIFPETLVALCRVGGYEEAYVMFPNGSGDLEKDRRSQGEYALVARKAARSRELGAS